MTGAAFAFALAAVGAADSEYPWTFDAATYVSRSGHYELFVEPSDRHGLGAGLCVLSDRGKELWRRELSVTLEEAVVTDTGVVAGYAYSEGVDGWRDCRGSLQVLVFEPNGDERSRVEIPREDDGFRPCFGGFVTVLVLDEDHDRFILGFAKSWWVYRLSDGEKTGELQPYDEVPTTENRTIGIAEVHPIEGVPLMLVRFREGDSSMGYYRSGALFALVDLEARPVWTLSLPRDYTIENDEHAQTGLKVLVERHGAVLATGERSFSLWHVADRLRVDYRVAVTGEGRGWIGRETSRAPFEPEPRVAVIDVELGSLGSQWLDSLTDFEPADPTTVNVIAQPGTKRRWEYDERELSLRGADGQILVTHDKRPGDRRWLRIDDCAVGPDGTLAVLSEGLGNAWMEMVEPGLSLFSPDGAPLRTVRLQEGTASAVAFQGRWAAICSRNPVVHLVDLADDSIRRFEFAKDLPGHSWYPSFSPDGRELWMTEPGERETLVNRYALPE